MSPCKRQAPWPSLPAAADNQLEKDESHNEREPDAEKIQTQELNVPTNGQLLERFAALPAPVAELPGARPKSTPIACTAPSYKMDTEKKLPNAGKPAKRNLAPLRPKAPFLKRRAVANDLGAIPKCIAPPSAPEPPLVPKAVFFSSP